MSARKSSTTVIIIVAGAVVLGMLMISCLVGILLPALGKARESARQMKSAAQLATIGGALQVYASNNKGQLPEVGADWKQRLLKGGAIMPEFLVSPLAEPGQESYFYVPGQKLSSSSTQVLAYENPEVYHGRGTNVLFMDGHVGWIEGAQVSAVLDNLKLPDGKAFAPHKK